MRNIGVFTDNRSVPIHRWYPFVEGYSAELVERALDGHQGSTGVIFDPFGGSGTTSLVAALRGWDSYFAEINPYLAWVAQVKVNSARRAARSKNLGRLESLAESLEAGEIVAGDEAHPLVRIDSQRRFFPRGVARAVVGVLEAIDRRLTSAARELARLAVATSLITSSNMVRRTDLRKRRPDDPPPRALNLTIAEQLRTIVADVRKLGLQVGGKAIRAAADVRDLQDFGNPIETIVTSPPYLNGTNYCRNTKLELLALSFIKSEADLAGLRDQAVAAGINNVSSRRPPHEEIPCVERVARRLDEVAYDRRIPSLVRSYFSDMRRVLGRLRSLSSKRARFFLDIGDSRFAGVHVPTHDLIAEIALDAGWEVLTTEVLRKRKSYDGSGLHQVLLEMRAK